MKTSKDPLLKFKFVCAEVLFMTRSKRIITIPFLYE